MIQDHGDFVFLMTAKSELFLNSCTVPDFSNVATAQHKVNLSVTQAALHF